MAERTEWIVDLDGRMVAEFQDSVADVTARGIDLFEVTGDDFPLPSMRMHFPAMLEALEGGRGFVLLRGLPVAQWTDRENRIAIWGLGTHLGLPVGQDRAGSLLHDVRDTGRRFGSDDSIRYYETSHAIRLHTDGGDIFALGCVRQGASGGRSLVVSAVEVFNEIVRRRPDLAVVLQQDFWMDARGQHPDGDRCQVLPIYTHHDGLLSIVLKPEYINSAQRFDDVPRLTDAQREARGARVVSSGHAGAGRGARIRHAARRRAAREQSHHHARTHGIRGRFRARESPPLAAPVAHDSQRPTVAASLRQHPGVRADFPPTHARLKPQTGRRREAGDWWRDSESIGRCRGRREDGLGIGGDHHPALVRIYIETRSYFGSRQASLASTSWINPTARHTSSWR